MKKYFLLITLLFQFSLAQADSVVCLHGFFRSYKCMIPIANEMRNEGMQVYLWDYPSRKKTIEEHAVCLVKVLNGIARRFPDEPIHFVTHSLGGIIVRAALNHPACPYEAKIGRASLLAPPNRGSALARKLGHCPLLRGIFGTKAGRELMTYSEIEMDNLGQFPETMDVMVVAGTYGSILFKRWMEGDNDGKVTVEETRLNSPHQHYVIHKGHCWIMSCRESMALTRRFLIAND